MSLHCCLGLTLQHQQHSSDQSRRIHSSDTEQPDNRIVFTSGAGWRVGPVLLKTEEPRTMPLLGTSFRGMFAFCGKMLKTSIRPLGDRVSERKPGTGKVKGQERHYGFGQQDLLKTRSVWQGKWVCWWWQGIIQGQVTRSVGYRVSQGRNRVSIDSQPAVGKHDQPQPRH